MRLLDVVQLLDLRIIEVDDLEVLNHALGSHGFREYCGASRHLSVFAPGFDQNRRRTADTRSVGLERKQDVGRSDAVFLCDLVDDRV